MDAYGYKKLSAPFCRRRGAVKLLEITNLVLTGLVYIAYPALMLYLLFFRRELFLRCLIVPGSTFIFVSGLRRVIDRPRPYELLQIRPLLIKDKQGESMPSRHVFSVFIIGTAFAYVFGIAAAIPFFAAGILMALIRVIGGVHFPSDVIVGAAIGIISGIIGFFII